MSDHLDSAALARMLKHAAEMLRVAREHLGALDAATGDGDHGAAMGKVADAIVACVDGAGESKPGEFLSSIGHAVMGVDAGSTGPLYGSLFLGMGMECAEVEEIDATRLAALFGAGLTKMRVCTMAMPGDKTMIDALFPAIEAARTSADAGSSVADTLAAAATAADRGATATGQMQAKFGRARHIGERSIGHIDPGAASMAVLFSGLQEGLNDHG